MRLGYVSLQMVMALAESERSSAPNCLPTPRADPELCDQLNQLLDEFGSAIEEIAVAIDRGCQDGDGDYETMPQFYAFKLLKHSIEYSESSVSWHLLRQIFNLCDNAHWLSESCAKGCIQDVEEAALTALRADAEPMIRELALEILAAGFVTEKSRSALELISSHDLSSADPCAKRNSLLAIDYTDGRSFPELVFEFQAAGIQCEQQLARSALKVLDQTGATGARSDDSDDSQP